MDDPFNLLSAAPRRLILSQAENRLNDLLSPETRTVVAETVKRWNAPLRAEVRAMTALKLADESGKPIVNISVEVTDGMPKPLAEQVKDFEDWQWLLILQHRQLKQAAEGMELLLREKERLRRSSRSPEMPSAAIAQSREYIAAVLTNSIDQEILEKFKMIEEDVLGGYWIKSSKIQIYWMPIAIFAPLFEVSVSDLTISTLCHELVHAYTHHGLDIDGNSWPTDQFSRAEIYVTEGIAQFYTEQVMRSISSRAPDALRTFCEKTRRQSKPYNDYQNWREGGRQATPEAVRLAMLRVRNNSPKALTYSYFREQIFQSQKQVRGD